VVVGLSNAHTAGPPGVMRTAWYWFMFSARSGHDSGMEDRIRTGTSRDATREAILPSCEATGRLRRLLGFGCYCTVSTTRAPASLLISRCSDAGLPDWATYRQLGYFLRGWQQKSVLWRSPIWIGCTFWATLVNYSATRN